MSTVVEFNQKFDGCRYFVFQRQTNKTTYKKYGERNCRRDMERMKLSEGEYRLMEIIWDKEPIPAARLAEDCNERYGWKSSTVYTMLKRMGAKGYLVFEKKIVKSLIEKEQVDKAESDGLIHKAYGDSLPDFIASFLKDRKLSKADAKRIQKMIKEAMEEE